MAKLNGEELREEYIINLKVERLESGLVGFLVFGCAIYLILSLANGLWKLLVIIPIVLIILLIKKLRRINKQIKDNQQKQKT